MDKTIPILGETDWTGTDLLALQAVSSGKITGPRSGLPDRRGSQEFFFKTKPPSYQLGRPRGSDATGGLQLKPECIRKQMGNENVIVPTRIHRGADRVAPIPAGARSARGRLCRPDVVTVTLCKSARGVGNPHGAATLAEQIEALVSRSWKHHVPIFPRKSGWGNRISLAPGERAAGNESRKIQEKKTVTEM